MFWINIHWLFSLNTKCWDHNFLFVNCPFQSIIKQTKIIRAVKSRALHALAIQPVTACAFCVARQPWHHALLMRWRTGNTVHCLLKEYYSSPQRENIKKQKKYEMVLEVVLAPSWPVCRSRPCVFERDVIWAPSRFAFEREFYTMTVGLGVLSRNCLFERINSWQCYDLTMRCSPLPLMLYSPLIYVVHPWSAYCKCAMK